MFAFNVSVPLMWLYVWFLDTLLPQGRPYAAVLHCVEGFFEVDGCDPQRPVPLGDSLPELLEREEVFCRAVARSEKASASSRTTGFASRKSFRKRPQVNFPKNG